MVYTFDCSYWHPKSERGAHEMAKGKNQMQHKNAAPRHYKNFVSMDIGLIGSGRVGSTIAMALADAGHRVFVGVRNELDFAGKHMLDGYKNIVITSVEDAGYLADVIILATPAYAVPEVAYHLGDVEVKVIIDLTNGPIEGPVFYANGPEAIERITRSQHVVKCFNTTNYLCLEDPQLSGETLETYVAGNTKKGKAVALALCRDLGINASYDLGGSENIPVLEKMVSCWISLDSPSERVKSRELQKITR